MKRLKFTDREIIGALKRSKGDMRAAAELLDVPYWNVAQHCRRNPKVGKHRVKNRQPKARKKYSDIAIVEALLRSDGNILSASRLLGCKSQSIYHRAARSPVVQAHVRRTLVGEAIVRGQRKTEQEQRAGLPVRVNLCAVCLRTWKDTELLTLCGEHVDWFKAGCPRCKEVYWRSPHENVRDQQDRCQHCRKFTNEEDWNGHRSANNESTARMGSIYRDHDLSFDDVSRAYEDLAWMDESA